METSPIPVKGFKFWPLFSTHGHWAERFFRVPYPLWHGASVYNSHFRRTETLTPFWAFSSGTVTICFYDLGLSRLGFEHPNFRLWGQRSNPIRKRRGLNRQRKKARQSNKLCDILNLKKLGTRLTTWKKYAISNYYDNTCIELNLAEASKIIQNFFGNFWRTRSMLSHLQ